MVLDDTVRRRDTKNNTVTTHSYSSYWVPRRRCAFTYVYCTSGISFVELDTTSEGNHPRKPEMYVHALLFLISSHLSTAGHAMQSYPLRRAPTPRHVNPFLGSSNTLPRAALSTYCNGPFLFDASSNSTAASFHTDRKDCCCCRNDDPMASHHSYSNEDNTSRRRNPKKRHRR